MGRGFSFALGRVLERMSLTSRAGRHKSQPQVDPARRGLATGRRRILEHVATMSTEKRLKMPR